MKVGLLDSTLREGEQSPNVSFTIDQKIKIVNALSRKYFFILTAPITCTSKIML